MALVLNFKFKLCVILWCFLPFSLSFANTQIWRKYVKSVRVRSNSEKIGWGIQSQWQNFSFVCNTQMQTTWLSIQLSFIPRRGTALKMQLSFVRVQLFFLVCNSLQYGPPLFMQLLHLVTKITSFRNLLRKLVFLPSQSPSHCCRRCR